MIVRFKKLNPEAKTPTKATEGSNGFDLYAINECGVRSDNKMLEYDTGIAIEIPKGFVGLVMPRSSISNKSIRLANSVGVIDSDYRGSIKLRFDVEPVIKDGKPEVDPKDIYMPGERIAQLLIVPALEASLEEGDLLNTERGNGGFGSSGQ